MSGVLNTAVAPSADRMLAAGLGYPLPIARDEDHDRTRQDPGRTPRFRLLPGTLERAAPAADAARRRLRRVGRVRRDDLLPAPDGRPLQRRRKRHVEPRLPGADLPHLQY